MSLQGVEDDELVARFESACYDRKVDYALRAEILRRMRVPPNKGHYDPRCDPATNWVLQYALELEQIQEARNHVMVGERGHSSPSAYTRHDH